MTGQRPNVLLIITDEWRAQAFGHAGDENARTPHLDRLASESLSLDQAIAGTPICCPSRASFLTGQYPLTHGVFINDVPLRPATRALPEVFAAAGYDTAHIGKWHLHGSPGGRFERRESYIPPEGRFGFRYWKSAECTHDYNRSVYFEGDDDTRRYWDGYDAIAQTADACAYLRRRTDDEPFFMVVSYGPPHFPLDSAPAPYATRYRDRPITLRANVPDARREEAETDLRGYYAHIAAVDDCVGLLMSTLEETGQDRSTIVVFTSDHGDMLFSQGLEHKLTPWEEAVRVPLLIRHAGTLPPARSQVLFNSPDLMPTLLGLAGLPVPAGVQGTDVLDRRAPQPTSAFLGAPVPFATMRQYGFGEYRGVRDERYTYVRTRNGPWLLYDNVADPYQMNNLCHRADARSERDRLDGELDRWLERLGDEFLAGEEYLRRDGLAHYYEATQRVGSAQSPWGDWASTMTPDEEPEPDAGWSVENTLLGEIYADGQGRIILEEELPDLVALAEFERCCQAPLSLLSGFLPDLLPPERIAAVSRRLAAVVTVDGHPAVPAGENRG
ncbi:sulfatase [Streptomyces sp. NPDC048291]|uniref:sulfatase family protein n=1 Tax=Streptomyces sp. NPDC048291 TaxID=3365530 RepID=UPI003715950A